MAKIDLKFLDIVESSRTISVTNYEDIGEPNEIRIQIESENHFETIYLDKSTAIKFAKTLRTEINKIES
jgi:uncharacterized protein (DUF39 family)